MDIILSFLLAISMVSVSSLPLENTGVDCGQCAIDFVESGGCDCLKQGDSCDVYSFVADECLVCEDESENPCPSENVCETNGGDDANQQCVFPFSYEGETYEKCTSVGNNGTDWCSTEVDENGEYVSGKWGNCGSGCFENNDALLLVPTCPRGESAECCDEDGSCYDGDDDWCCDAVFYCSNDGVEYAKEKEGILCPGNNNSNEDVVDDNNGVPICPEGGLAECCDVDESCYDGDDDWCCNGSFYCSNDGAEYAEENGGVLCPGNDATAGGYTDVCETIGGDDANQQCVFPFSYQGVTYEQCTSVGNNGTQWCSTEVDENGEYVSGKWGSCGSGCDKDVEWIQGDAGDPRSCDELCTDNGKVCSHDDLYIGEEGLLELCNFLVGYDDVSPGTWEIRPMYHLEQEKCYGGGNFDTNPPECSTENTHDNAGRLCPCREA